MKIFLKLGIDTKLDNFFSDVLYQLIVTLYQLAEICEILFSQLIGIKPIGSMNNYELGYDFSGDKDSIIGRLFFRNFDSVGGNFSVGKFIGVALAVAIVIFVLSTIIRIITNAIRGDTGEGHKKTIMLASKSVVTMVFTPIIFMVAIYTVTQFLNAISTVIVGEDQHTSVFNIFTSFFDETRVRNENGNFTSSFNIGPHGKNGQFPKDHGFKGLYDYFERSVFTYERDTYFGRTKKRFVYINDFRQIKWDVVGVEGWDSNFNGFFNRGFYFGTALVGGAVLFICFFMMTINAVARLVNLFVLFVTGPSFAATFPLDDGKRFEVWRQQVLVKMIGVVGNIVALYAYIFLLKTINAITSGISTGLFAESVYNSILRMIVACGGAIAVNQGNQLLTSIISNNLASSEGLSALQAGRIMGAGAKLGAGVLGLGALASKDKGKSLLGKFNKLNNIGKGFKASLGAPGMKDASRSLALAGSRGGNGIAGNLLKSGAGKYQSLVQNKMKEPGKLRSGFKSLSKAVEKGGIFGGLVGGGMGLLFSGLKKTSLGKSLSAGLLKHKENKAIKRVAKDELKKERLDVKNNWGFKFNLHGVGKQPPKLTRKERKDKLNDKINEIKNELKHR